MRPRQLHLRINRVVVQCSPGQSAAQVSRQLEQALAQMIKVRLARGAAAFVPGAGANLREPIADAVAACVHPDWPTP